MALDLEPEDVEMQRHLTTARFEIQKQDIKVDNSGKVIDEDVKTNLKGYIIGKLRKPYIDPLIQANKGNTQYLQNLAQVLEEGVAQLEVYFGGEAFISLISSTLLNTQNSINIIFSHPLLEVLTHCAEFAYNNKEKSITLIASWDMEVFGEILSKLISLGNIQVKHLYLPSDLYAVFKDDNIVILAPASEDLNTLVCIKSTHKDLIAFFSSFILPIFNAQSRPIK